MIRPNTILAGLIFIALASPSYAYLGPGIGGGFLAAVLGVIGAFFLAIIGVLYFPIKRALAARRDKKANEGETKSDLE